MRIKAVEMSHLQTVALDDQEMAEIDRKMEMLTKERDDINEGLRSLRKLKADIDLRRDLTDTEV